MEILFNLNLGIANTIGEPISPNLFGGNIIADKDIISGGTFLDTVEKLGISTLRYPGGGVTELYFDVENPDSTTGTWGGKMVPISEFIEFANAKSIQPIIVIPTLMATRRSVDDSGLHIVDGSDVESIKNYVSDILNGKYGETDVSIFEIGNEFYNSSYLMTAADYGNVAGQISVAVQEAIDEFKVNTETPVDWVEPKIFVQSGRNLEEANLILEQFDVNERSVVDGVSAHMYPWSFEGFFGEKTNEKFEVMDIWSSQPGFSELEYFISEWNIGSPNGEDGLAHASSMIAGIETMVRHGVDYASVWPLQAATQNELDSPEGKESALRVAGEVYNMMSDSLIGTRLLDLNSGNSEFVVQGFEGSDKTVLFISSRTLESIDIDIDVSGLVSSFSHAWGEKISAVTWANSVEDPTLDKRAMPYVQTYSSPDYFDSSTESIHLDGYEIIRIEFTTSKSGASLAGQEELASLYSVPLDQSDSLYGGIFSDHIEGFVGDDNLYGRGGSDSIYGGVGVDQIVGGRGNDLLFGEKGDDFIKGNSGNDTLIGGDEDDFLKGGIGDDELYGGMGEDKIHAGAGNDILYGGQGADKLRGGDGNDKLEGGQGNDILFGGMGEDVFIFNVGDGSDKIQSFEDGVDLIRFVDSRIGIEEITISNSHNNTVVSYSIDGNEDVITLARFDSIFLTAEDFIFG